MSSKGDSGEDDWSNITDPREKRRIQVRNAQRRFRARAKEKEEEDRRKEANERLAGSSYQTYYGSQETDDRADNSGPPWGQIPFGYGISLNRNQSNHSSPQGDQSSATATSGPADQMGATSSSYTGTDKNNTTSPSQSGGGDASQQRA